MAELPEVETLRRDLDRDVVGKKVKTVEVVSMKAIRRHPNKTHFGSKLEGEKLTSVQRRGTLLLLGVGDDEFLVVDLGGSGRLLRAQNRDEVVGDTQVVITFTQHGQLRLLDDKGSAELFVVARDGLEDEVPELARIGLDPIEHPISWTAFGEQLRERRARLKSVLTDPTFLAGIGNVYSDEILYAAGLRYDRSSETLSTQEVRRLYRALVETLHEAIKHRGATLESGPFHDLFGEPGGFGELGVYGREGESCRRCRHDIEKARVGNRTTYFCPQCQV